MAMRSTGKFIYGLSRARVRALNDDKTRIKYILGKDGSYSATNGNGRIVGGTGPFDCSGAAAPAAVPLTIKFDNQAEVTVNVNLTVGVVDIDAVTVDEAVARINAAAPTDITASKEAATQRLLLVYSGTDDPEYIQVYGEAARLFMIGQGLGQKFVKMDTLQSLTETPTKKDDETINISPANGADTEVILEGYKKGITAKMVDTVEDFELMELIEGGVIDTNGIYHDPNEDTVKKYFEIELYNPIYGEGSNKEGEIVEWEQTIFQTCSGSVGENAKGRSFMPKNYDIVGTNYTNIGATDAAYQTRDGAVLRKRLTLAQWNALDFDNV